MIINDDGERIELEMSKFKKSNIIKKLKLYQL